MNFGEGLCARSTFFLFSVFSDFEIDDFWHLWYIIVKPLKSLFICTKASLLVLFVWKLRGFKVLKNEQMNSEMRWTARWTASIITYIYVYISVNTNIFEIYIYMSGTQSNYCLIFDIIDIGEIKKNWQNFSEKIFLQLVKFSMLQC